MARQFWIWWAALRSFDFNVSKVPLLASSYGPRPSGRTGGSVRDRAARNDPRGEESGALTPGRIIIDATSGNTGIAYAMVGASRGYQVKLCLPDNASPERKMILRRAGADLVLTDPLEGTDGAIRERAPPARRRQNAFSGPANEGSWRAHYDTTSPELSNRPAGPDALCGRAWNERDVRRHGRRLRQFNPAIRLISFQPSGFHGEGLKHMESALVPAIYDSSIADEDLRVDSERSYEMVRRLARETGLLVGISSGAALAVMLQVAQRLERGVVVSVFPDGAAKYLTEKFWEADA